jgi:hypothetical protein
MTANDYSQPGRPTADGGVWGSYIHYLERLERDVVFWKDQQKLAANVAATIADLDEEAPALRQLLRGEIKRRRTAEHRVAVLEYRLQEIQGTQA